MKVRDVMTRDVISVVPETPLRDVARLLEGHQISGVPVVDPDGLCVGVVSEADVLAKLLNRAPSRRTLLAAILGERHDPDEMRRQAAKTAAQAMSLPAITIDADRPLREAAALMVDRGVNRLPVLTQGCLTGIITRADLVRAYLSLDHEIARAIRDDILRREIWIDPDAFDIHVREGVVRISGTADRRSTATIIARLIGLVDGVVDVHSEIGWEMDDQALEPVGPEHEPGAASPASRERPLPLHR